VRRRTATATWSTAASRAATSPVTTVVRPRAWKPSSWSWRRPPTWTTPNANGTRNGRRSCSRCWNPCCAPRWAEACRGPAVFPPRPEPRSGMDLHRRVRPVTRIEEAHRLPRADLARQVAADPARAAATQALQADGGPAAGAVVHRGVLEHHRMGAVVEQGLHAQRPAAVQRAVALEAVPFDHRAGFGTAGAGARAAFEVRMPHLPAFARPQVVVVDEEAVEAGLWIVGAYRQAAAVAVVAAIVLGEAGGRSHVAVAGNHQAVHPGLEQLEGLAQLEHRRAVVGRCLRMAGHQLQDFAAAIQPQPGEDAVSGDLAAE